MAEGEERLSMLNLVPFVAYCETLAIDGVEALLL